MSISCSESDPRPRLSKFVSDPSVKTISGLRSEGLGTLLGLVQEEVRRQSPDTEILVLDRDFMSDHHVLTAKELGSALVDITFGKRYAIFLDISFPVVNWQEALDYLGDDVSVYVGSLACRQVPVCTRIRRYHVRFPYRSRSARGPRHDPRA